MEMYKKFEMELAGRTLRVDVDRVAKQANGAVLIHYGDTVVLSTATASKQPREGIDFFPAAFLQSLLLMIAGLLCLRFYILCKEKGTKNLLNLEL